jgi:hypothetical protein
MNAYKSKSDRQLLEEIYFKLFSERFTMEVFRIKDFFMVAARTEEELRKRYNAICAILPQRLIKPFVVEKVKFGYTSTAKEDDSSVDDEMERAFQNVIRVISDKFPRKP